MAGIAGFTMRNKDGSDDSSSSTTTSSSSKAGEPAKIDVSIPYNAAARLAYDEWKKSNASSNASFEQYEPLYIKKTVADVTAKKVTRDMELAVKEAQAAAKSVDAELAQL